MNNWLSKICIDWLLIDDVYNCQVEVQNIYDVSCANTNITVLKVYLYDNTYFPRNTFYLLSVFGLLLSYTKPLLDPKGPLSFREWLSTIPRNRIGEGCGPHGALDHLTVLRILMGFLLNSVYSWIGTIIPQPTIPGEITDISWYDLFDAMQRCTTPSLLLNMLVLWQSHSSIPLFLPPHLLHQSRRCA